MITTPQQIDDWRTASSEHQRLEFKEAKKSFAIQKLYKYCVAIANEGGGHLLLGVADKPPRPVVGTHAFRNPVDTEEKVFQKLSFRVDIEEVDHPNGRVLVFHIPPRPRGIPYELDGKFLMRAGSSLVPMSVDRLRRIIAESPSDWNQSAHASVLVAANLLGAWNEGNVADLEIVNRIAKMEYPIWIPKIREMVHQPVSPVKLKDGRWCVTERKELWRNLGPRVFDDDLDILAECAVTVLSERDPQFELPPQARFAASFHGRELKYSSELREGLAESLALLGVQPNELNNCSQNRLEFAVVHALREIFENADWVLWGSLNDLLPILAEAAPDEFLTMVENALQQTSCPFDKLFEQEGGGVIGRNYLTGLLWALEGLAWDETFLVRVCVILGELADRDPGGNWGNRPSNSLTEILLPWIPQTTAPILKRTVAVKTLRREVPAVAWKLLLSLLPNQTETSSPTHKPSWRSTIPDDWKESVTKKEYREQVYYYAEMTVAMARDDLEKLKELVYLLDSLPRPAFNRILRHLSSKAVVNLPEGNRLGLWTRLTMFTREHRRFPNANWALKNEVVTEIESVAAKLAPKNPLNLYRMLFSRQDHILYEETENSKEQQKKLDEKRRQAIKDILHSGGMEAIVQFVKDVESPLQVGNSLGVVAKAKFDDRIFPTMLATNDGKLVEFTGAYVWSRRKNYGWEWLDGLDRSGWSVLQMSQFLSYLPFAEETWRRAAAWLGKSEEDYWRRTNANPYDASGDIGFAIGKLIENGRIKAAIHCLSKQVRDKQVLDKDQAVRALLAAGTSIEPLVSLDKYDIIEIIRALQDDPETNPGDLSTVELVYLPLLNRYIDENVSPITLENRLASDPAFFCEAICRSYRSKKEPKPKGEPSEQEKAIAQKIGKLLRKWRTPPGTQPDSTFLPDQFQQWLRQVQEHCAESGHLEVALTHIGQVLFYSSSDPDGLWIHSAVAGALNDRSAAKMRVGYHTEAFNSRGANFVVATGEPERELAKQYRQKAEDVENSGYQRFATELRRIAKYYDIEAERIVAEHNGENTDESKETVDE